MNTAHQCEYFHAMNRMFNALCDISDLLSTQGEVDDLSDIVKAVKTLCDENERLRRSAGVGGP